MSNLPAVNQQQAQALEQVLIGGDLSKLKPEERVMYYKQVCESVGLNPITKPFEYITLNGKLTLYALRSCTEQLRKIHGVSIIVASREVVEGCYVVTARATDAKGRNDESIGAVPIDGIKGEARSNAMMKAETKAKRRVTLSICGLGMLDESEADSVPGAYPAPITPTAGALQALSEKERDVIVETAAELKGLMANGQDGDAYALWKNSKFDADHEVAFWAQLDSKTRAALKKMEAAEKAQEQGTISPAKHKRIEALIKEFKLNRDGLKDWCVAQFNKGHFNELTNDEYEKLDAHIAQIAAPLSSPPSEADGGAAFISVEQLKALEIVVEMKGIKGRFDTKLAASGIKSPDKIPANKFAAIEKWVTEAK